MKVQSQPTYKTVSNVIGYLKGDTLPGMYDFISSSPCFHSGFARDVLLLKICIEIFLQNIFIPSSCTQKGGKNLSRI